MDNSFLLERYKYILEQKKHLNRATFAIAVFYQSIFGIILAAQFQVVRFEYNGAVPLNTAKGATIGLVALSGFLSIICIALLAGGMASWLKYRRDEADIDSLVFGFRREAPTWKDTVRWYESYIIVAIALASIIYASVAYLAILPQIRN